jgi:hypothetical protein
MMIFGRPFNKQIIKQFVLNHKTEIFALTVAFILGALLF